MDSLQLAVLTQEIAHELLGKLKPKKILLRWRTGNVWGSEYHGRKYSASIGPFIHCVVELAKRSEP